MSGDLEGMSISDLVLMMEANYYYLASTGADAFGAFADDMARGAFTEYHGLDETTVALLTMEFAKKMVEVWYTPAWPLEEIRKS